MKKYPLAKNGIFWSIQGEGHLRGFQMAFVRLAGCSVGCPQCDTDYGVNSRHSAVEIARMASEVTDSNCRDRWVWITGGEPTDHNLTNLITALKELNFSICVATSGSKRFTPTVDWLSVSPHGPTVQLYGNEIKLIDGLNGLNLEEWLEIYPDSKTDFWYRYVQPLSINNQEVPESLDRCLKFLEKHPNWSLSRQDHHYWRKP